MATDDLTEVSSKHCFAEATVVKAMLGKLVSPEYFIDVEEGQLKFPLVLVNFFRNKLVGKENPITQQLIIIAIRDAACCIQQC